MQWGLLFSIKSIGLAAVHFPFWMVKNALVFFMLRMLCSISSFLYFSSE